MKNSMIMGLLFAVFFGLYVHTAAPHVAPYRDAGEMVVLDNTLGVAHPPGYPLYTVVTNFWKNLPVGNVAYRMNIFSGFAAALAVALFFLLLRVWMGPSASVIGAVSLGLSTVFWELALVSEMYAFGALMLVLVFLAMFRWKSVPLAAFLFALALGVRMDLLLFIPLLLYWAWEENRFQNWHVAGIAAVLGMSVFLYMVVRSLQNPLLDWGNPDNLGALFNSMSRKSYASTLDLLSLSYKRGENFGVSAALYAKHVVRAFTIPGVILAVLGLYGAALTQRKSAVIFIGGFLIAGPVFLFMANMPPNPHAVAIIEASYLLPDIFIALFIGFGLNVLTPYIRFYRLLMLIVIAGLVVQFPISYTRVSKRNNFYVRDYVTNLLRSTPKDGVVVLHKDVQIFSLWVAQIIDGKRLDVAIVPTGLSASPWYWEMKKRWGTEPSPEVSLQDPNGWVETAQMLRNRPFLAGYDVDIPGVMFNQATPHGLLLQVAPAQAGAQAPNKWLDSRLRGNDDQSFILPELGVYRGRYRYGQTPDFFSTDLIGDTAKAYHRHGLAAMNAGHVPEADWFFAASQAFDPTFPRAASDRGYLMYIQNHFDAARLYQKRAVDLYSKMLEQTKEFNSLPDVAAAIKVDLSSAYLNLGVSTEKSGDVETARRYYEEASRAYPNAQAHYNLGVTYWGKDWGKAAEEFEQTLRINSQFPDAGKFWTMARMKMGAK